jgi:hypothetical protein
MNIDYDTVKDLAGAVKSGLLAAFGGVVGYATDVVHRGKPFSWVQYMVFVVVAFFVGQVLDSWLPLSLPGRGGVLMVAGTSAYPILVTLQAKVTDLVNRLH